MAFTEGYDEPLAHRILAGSDIVLVPSRYEPCGLTQMYALRYGSIPVVRATGGLADTIQHFDPEPAPATGAVFRDADVGGLLWATRRALEWYDVPAAWSRLIANAMRADFSWDKQVPAYEAVYRTRDVTCRLPLSGGFGRWRTAAWSCSAHGRRRSTIRARSTRCGARA